jgi:hypothetical protein
MNLIRRNLTDADIRMLRAALLDGEPARTSFRAWREHLDWENISRSWQRLIPLLQSNLIAQSIDDPLIERFRGLRRYFWLRNLKQMQLAFAAIDALAAAGVPVLALKGLSIIACYFRDRSLRPMEDIDLLVSPAHVEAATEALVALGVSPLNLRPRAISELAHRRDFAGWPFKNAQGDYFDLHWCALHLDRRPGTDTRLWDAAVPVEVDGRRLMVLSPADRFIHACAHTVRDDDPSTLRAAADCATILRRGGIDAGRLHERADKHRVRPAVADMLDFLADDIDFAPARSLRRPAWRPGQRLQLRLLARPSHPDARRSLLRAAATLQRGDATLFDAPLPLSLWRVLGRGHAGGLAPVRLALFDLLGRPSWLRPWLASDLLRAGLDAERLPPAAGGGDLIADGLWRGLISGWSVDEETGRWTDGQEAVLCWANESRSVTPLFLALRWQPIQFTEDPIEIEIRANDRPIGHFVLGSESDLPGHIRLPREAVEARNRLVVVVTIRNPVRPSDVGISNDNRALGVLFTSARLAPAADA